MNAKCLSPSYRHNATTLQPSTCRFVGASRSLEQGVLPFLKKVDPQHDVTSRFLSSPISLVIKKRGGIFQNKTNHNSDDSSHKRHSNKRKHNAGRMNQALKRCLTPVHRKSQPGLAYTRSIDYVLFFFWYPFLGSAQR